MSEPMTAPDEAQCRHCERWWPTTNYYVRSSGRRYSWCKPCWIAWVKATGRNHVRVTEEERARHRERERLRHANASPEKRAHRKVLLAAYRIANREKLLAYYAAWRKKHPERYVTLIRVWGKRHPERLTEYQRRRRALKCGNEATLTHEQWATILAAADGRCFYCGEQRPLTMDHIAPLSRGGPHTASNIVAACQPCNSSKNARTVDEFRAMRGGR